MAKILTGVQSTGTPHLGNLLGAIIPSIQMANKSNEESYFFIANLHSLTQIKDPEVLQKNTFSTAAAWLSFGLDTNKACWKGKIPFRLKLFCSALISNGELIGRKYEENLVAFSCSS